jgi:hypothetical protein
VNVDDEGAEIREEDEPDGRSWLAEQVDLLTLEDGLEI